jgi:hypothetical protein
MSDGPGEQFEFEFGERGPKQTPAEARRRMYANCRELKAQLEAMGASVVLPEDMPAPVNPSAEGARRVADQANPKMADAADVRFHRRNRTVETGADGSRRIEEKESTYEVRLGIGKAVDEIVSLVREASGGIATLAKFAFKVGQRALAKKGRGSDDGGGAASG